MMRKEDLAKRIRATSFLTGEFLLRSGMTTSFYLDKYRFESDPILLTAIAQHLQNLLPESCNRIAGLELGGIPLATALSLLTGKPCLFVRKQAKAYGTCKLVEGGFGQSDIVVVVEDVVTTAGQVCESIKHMREAGLVIEQAVCVIDRQQGGRQRLEEAGCDLLSLFTVEELDDMIGRDTSRA